MELYYKNETLFVDVRNAITVEAMAVLERKVFRILDDYGIDKIIISIFGEYDKHLLDDFKRKYYCKYTGYLLIK